MQRNTQVDNCNIQNKKRKPLNPIALLLLLAALFHWTLFFVYVAGQLEIRPTALIVKKEGCGYMRQIGITAKIHESGETCRVEVPYRANLIGSGGRIYLDDKQISIAENQIVAAAPLENQPWSPSQRRLVTWLSISLVLVLIPLIFII